MDNRYTYVIPINNVINKIKKYMITYIIYILIQNKI
jgi:hypothetical protein